MIEHPGDRRATEPDDIAEPGAEAAFYGRTCTVAGRSVTVLLAR